MLNRDVCLKCHLDDLSSLTNEQKKLGRDLFFLDWRKGRVCCIGFNRSLLKPEDVVGFESSMIKIANNVPKFCKHIEEQNSKLGD